MPSLQKTKQKMRSSVRAPSVGSTVMGERGQVVIPKEFRDQLKLKSGSRLMVIHHQHGPLILLPAEQMQGFIDQMTQGLLSFSSNAGLR